ncbi:MULTISPECIES: hypothetical protein [Sphingobacterium]|uniref:hypothetical protein n=1 Tax=Sphingobacterium TaxID=28453 RepID=UPI0013D923B6|nr:MULTISPECIES: hypothetical protein [unclassified Sphingobacterium]
MNFEVRYAQMYIGLRVYIRYYFLLTLYHPIYQPDITTASFRNRKYDASKVVERKMYLKGGVVVDESEIAERLL